jgi:hypothetical protein
MAKKTVSFSLPAWLVNLFINEHIKYPGSKSEWAEAIFKPALACISEHGFDEFVKRLRAGIRTENFEDHSGSGA